MEWNSPTSGQETTFRLIISVMNIATTQYYKLLFVCKSCLGLPRNIEQVGSVYNLRDLSQVLNPAL
jgi:hypothetical protein